ncbi:MAG: type II toxin-antitoxin system VapC family toxin [Nitrospira sp.]|nr:type II toxin-antitoxin system VapC family toxin [Nitrospira sp.]MDH4251406.1 type II toxin-antitoxin system VapC family toxin [Nitrospira sp.]MDH4343350.1 type II toxin-antitoxin system VapC family toxin [Nitrospira sp.]MDH5336722.1 type II toxin-antitoxin system VapC family toxin [Nitrospira sp.]
MLCLDTSSLIAYLQGEEGADVDLVDQALIDQVGVLSPVTVAELLSDPDLSQTLRRTILELPTLSMSEGVWERAGLLRAKVLRTGRRANLADTLIAQSCLDHHATLVTRDRDFKTFVSAAGLRVAIPYS